MTNDRVHGLHGVHGVHGCTTAHVLYMYMYKTHPWLEQAHKTITAGKIALSSDGRAEQRFGNSSSSCCCILATATCWQQQRQPLFILRHIHGLGCKQRVCCCRYARLQSTHACASVPCPAMFYALQYRMAQKRWLKMQRSLVSAGSCALMDRMQFTAGFGAGTGLLELAQAPKD